jgi:SAM-dependent methyltransferase
MDWKRKAQIQRTLAAMPMGATLYVQIQRHFGKLAADPFKRVPNHVRMLQMLQACGFTVEGSRCLEVGTGHIPALPFLYHLAGAKSILTVDLYPRLQWSEMGASLRQLISREDELVESYGGLVEEADLRRRVAAMGRFLERPQEFFEHAGIRYLAPGDAAAVDAADGSFDLHTSTNVLEHIPPPVIADILEEAHRLLGEHGLACHTIDPGDHFNSPGGVSAVNFLQFSEEQWDRIAGNQFAYHNRMRYPQFLDAFENAGLRVIDAGASIDEKAMQALKDGLTVDPVFAGFTPEELSSVRVAILAGAG